MYSEEDANNATVLSDDEIVDTRDGYTYRVIAFNLEHNMFWTRSTGVRESNWEYLYEGDEEETNLRFQYAETIAGLCAVQGIDVPHTITTYLPGYLELPDESTEPKESFDVNSPHYGSNCS